MNATAERGRLIRADRHADGGDAGEDGHHPRKFGSIGARADHRGRKRKEQTGAHAEGESRHDGHRDGAGESDPERGRTEQDDAQQQESPSPVPVSEGARDREDD